MKLWSSMLSSKTTDPGSLTPPATKLLKFFDLTTLGLGSCLGFGISVLIGHLLKNVTGPAVVVSIFVAGVAALIGGLCFAEFGVRLLKLDSAYGYCYLWGKEPVAFVFGWALTLQYVAGIASGARGVTAFLDSLTEHQISDFLKSVTPLSSCDRFPYFDFISLSIVVVITILIALGMRDSIAVKKAFTAFNIVLIITIIAAGAFRADPKNWNAEPAPGFEPGFTPFGVLGVAKGAAIAFYGFIGFDTVSITGNEIQKRKRNLPLAISATVILTLLAFAGVGVVLTLLLPYHSHDTSAAVPFAFQEAGWTALKWIVAAGAFFGFQTSLFGAAFVLPRIIHAMANDGLLFHCLGNSHSRLRIPVAASAAGGLASAVVAGFVLFENLVNLAVMGALFVFTTLAINIILLRYSQKSEATEEHLSESWSQLISTNSEVSVKSVLKNYFNFTAKTPTNLSKTIVLVNLLLFCTSSIAISIFFNYLHERLIEFAAEAIIPVGIFLTFLCLNLISMTCQPKSRESAPFKVPLVPLLPCLSIFLNIFLMLTFDSLSWILFSIWMALGIVPYSAWRCVKCFKEEVGENSLFEINKSNAVKLSDSIWKIKSDKKSFYEGAINPVFSDDLDEPSKVPEELGTENETGLQQVDVIQKAESVEEEKAKPLENELELNFFYAENAEVRGAVPEEEKVQWECVAEIHTEDEIPQESIALEIVDNTYNFLTELAADDTAQSSDWSQDKSEDVESLQNEKDTSETEEVSDENAKEHGLSLFKNELLSKIQKKTENEDNNNNKRNSNSLSTETEGTKETSSEESSAEPVQISTQTNLNDPKIEKPLNPEPNDIKPEEQESTQEQNKVKEFKEKLNQLLKNQINGGTTLTKSSPFSKANAASDLDPEVDSDDKDNYALRNSVKTLNKSQIKSKLELLLTKGPPKRPSLGSSFNIKVKETNKENQAQNSKEEFLNDRNHEISNFKDGGQKTEKITADSTVKSEKMLPLEKDESTNDVCC